MLKNKLKKKQLTIGTWITLSDSLIPYILSSANFDWMCIDIEHSALDFSNVQVLINSIKSQNITPLVRVTSNDADIIKRVMDFGSSGVIVPNINTKDDAIKAVNSVKYPPLGNRGMGLFTAQNFEQNLNEYIKWNQNNSIVIVQIESKNALNNIDEILSTKGIDGFFIGPYDLSASMNIPGKFNHPKFKKAIKKIMDTSVKYNIPAGIHSVSTDFRKVNDFIKKNFKIIAYSIDSILLRENAISGMRKIKRK